MNTIEKRDFIHSHLHQIDDKLIDDLYELMQKEEILKDKLSSRAQKSENDIKNNKLFNRQELEQRSF